MAHASANTSKAPNGIDKLLNQPEEPRDSGFFANDSKHTSLNSTTALTPSSGGYHSSADHTPSPIATNMEPGGLPLASPASAMSVAAMVSPTSTEHTTGRQRESGYESMRNSAGYANGDSRRESVSSSVYQNMDQLRINPGSPYGSQNPSTTSLQETLNQQRNPGERPGFSRFANSYQPSTARTPEVNGPYARKAPLITGPAPGSIARAAEATKGQAWAFPEVEVQRIPSTARPSGDGAGYEDSRRSSLASISSSQYTTESRYPPSQRRLEDGMPPDFNRHSRASSEFQGTAQQHHHHQLTRLQSEEASSPTGSAQPYSRTPELRITHKLAERKRRTEMKDLFEKLAARLPSDGRSTKSSKWETLSKAITEIERQQSLINSQQQQLASQGSQIQALQGQNDHLRSQVGGGGSHHTNSSGHYTSSGSASSAPINDVAPPPSFQWGPPASQLAPAKSSHQSLPVRVNGQRSANIELPSIHSLQPNGYSSQPMTGLEYPPSGSYGAAEPSRHQF